MCHKPEVGKKNLINPVVKPTTVILEGSNQQVTD